jgi:hypothetical protein
MVERPEIELSRERGEWVEAPRGPLDKPRTLWFAMAVWGGLTTLAIVMGFITGKAWFGIPSALFAFMGGTAFAGRFPALFFRRDRN